VIYDVRKLIKTTAREIYLNFKLMATFRYTNF